MRPRAWLALVCTAAAVPCAAGGVVGQAAAAPSGAPVLRPAWSRGIGPADGGIAVDADRVYVAHTYTVVAVSRRDGHLLWRQSATCDGLRVVAAGRLGASCAGQATDGGAVVFDGATGRRLLTVPDGVICSADTRGATILRSVGPSDVHTISRHDFATGKVQWSRVMHQFDCLGAGEYVVVMNDCCSGDGPRSGFEVFDARTGRQLAHHPGSFLGLDPQGRSVTCLYDHVSGFDMTGQRIWTRRLQCSDDGFWMTGPAVFTDQPPITELAVADGHVFAHDAPVPRPNGTIAGPPFDVLIDIGATNGGCGELRFLSPAGVSPVFRDVTPIWAPLDNHSIVGMRLAPNGCAKESPLEAVDVDGATDWRTAPLSPGDLPSATATDAGPNHDATALTTVDDYGTLRLYELP